MNKGIIYLLFKYILDNFNKLSAVEWLKKCLTYFFPKVNKVTKSRLAVDLFILLKWFFVLVLWKFALKSTFCTFLVWYLLITNLHTYFYYHIWCDEAITPVYQTADRVRRRFVNLLLAVAFSNICFAYLYRFPYLKEFEWGDGISGRSAIWFSISNSLAANYEVVKADSPLGDSLSMIQLIFTFIFISIVLSKPIPEVTSNSNG